MIVTQQVCFRFRGKLFGGTAPPNNTLFGGTVPPNSTLFGGTPDSDKEYFISVINELVFTLRNQQSQLFLRNFFGHLMTACCWSHPKKWGGGICNQKVHN